MGVRMKILTFYPLDSSMTNVAAVTAKISFKTNAAEFKQQHSLRQQEPGPGKKIDTEISLLNRRNIKKNK